MTNEKLSDVKTIILKVLSSGEWVSSFKLLKITKQKYFDRRIRELRDELGYDIETGNQNGEAHYRLKSDTRLPLKLRTYLGARERKELLRSNPASCAICGCKFSQSKKSVFDHRVPLIRGGAGDILNYQLLCVDCNNQKRSQCRGCDLDCATCFLAYPEKFPPAIMLRILDKNEYARIQEAAQKEKLTIEQFFLNSYKKLL